jgi:hypothetical protein
LKQFSQDNDFFPFWHKMKLAIEGRLSTPRRIEAWVSQGCVLAPYLYTHVQLMPPQYLVLVWVCSRVIHVRSDGEVRPHRAPKSANVGDKDKTKYFFFFASLAMKLMCLANDVFHRPFSFVFFNARVSFSMNSSALSLRMLFVCYQWSDEEDG